MEAERDFVAGEARVSVWDDDGALLTSFTGPRAATAAVVVVTLWPRPEPHDGHEVETVASYELYDDVEEGQRAASLYRMDTEQAALSSSCLVIRRGDLS